MHSDQLVAAVAHALASLPVDVDDDCVFVMQEKPVRRMVDEGTKTRFARPQLLLGMPPIRDIDHEADHAVGSALGVEGHAPFRLQPVHGAVLVIDPVLGLDITRFVRTLERELHRRPVIGMDELLPALVRSIERTRLQAIHHLEVGRPTVFALASADVPIECHRACRLLREIEHFLPRPELRFDALALGDVAHDGKHQVLAAMGNSGDGHLDRNPAPAAVQVNRFERGAPVLLDPLANDPPDLPADFRCLQGGHFHVEQFLARIAEERAGSLVDLDDLVALVLQEYGVVRLLEERPVALLALAQSRLRPAATP